MKIIFLEYFEKYKQLYNEIQENDTILNAFSQSSDVMSSPVRKKPRHDTVLSIIYDYSEENAEENE